MNDLFKKENFLVKNAPKTVFYIRNFLTIEEENRLLKEIYDSPKPKWTQLKNRRLQNWGGIPQSKGMIVEKIPNWLDEYCLKIYNCGFFEQYRPNHILINEYLPGQGRKIFILISTSINY